MYTLERACAVSEGFHANEQAGTMDIKSFKGIAVVSIDDGARVGAVSDILFDLEQRQIRAFIVGEGKLLGGVSRILDIADVKSIGADALMIPSRDLLKADREDDRYKRYANLHAVMSLKVVSETGNFVGNLSTVQIETEGGTFTDIEVGQRGLLSTFHSKIVVPAGSVTAFGRDVVIIPKEFVPAAEPKDASATADVKSKNIESHSVG